MTPLKSRRKVLIVSEAKGFHENLAAVLPKDEFFPIFHAASGGEARRMLTELPVDILIVDSPLPDEHGVMFAENYCDSNMGILLLVNKEQYDDVSYKVEEEGILTLPKPTSPELFFSAIKMLSAMTFKLQKMETENRSLKEKMQDIRIVNRAKWLLIDRLGLSERDAHRRIEKLAMDRRLPRREIAEEIIARYEK